MIFGLRISQLKVSIFVFNLQNFCREKINLFPYTCYEQNLISAPAELTAPAE